MVGSGRDEESYELCRDKLPCSAADDEDAAAVEEISRVWNGQGDCMKRKSSGLGRIKAKRKGE